MKIDSTKFIKNKKDFFEVIDCVIQVLPTTKHSQIHIKLGHCNQNVFYLRSTRWQLPIMQIDIENWYESRILELFEVEYNINSKTKEFSYFSPVQSRLDSLDNYMGFNSENMDWNWLIKQLKLFLIREI